MRVARVVVVDDVDQTAVAAVGRRLHLGRTARGVVEPVIRDGGADRTGVDQQVPVMASVAVMSIVTGAVEFVVAHLQIGNGARSRSDELPAHTGEIVMVDPDVGSVVDLDRISCPDDALVDVAEVQIAHHHVALVPYGDSLALDAGTRAYPDEGLVGADLQRCRSGRIVVDIDQLPAGAIVHRVLKDTFLSAMDAAAILGIDAAIGISPGHSCTPGEINHPVDANDACAIACQRTA